MAYENNDPLGPNDRVSIIRRDDNLVGTPASVTPDRISEAIFTPAEPIADLDLSGTYDGDDADIQGAVNDILDALRANGIVLPTPEP